jgi:hypothetical protein
MQKFDFDGAVTMHRSWKMRFHLALDAIRGPDYDTQPLGDDAQCPLGHWLAGNAAELERFESARELMAIHRDFHRQSESIADDIRMGRVVHLSDEPVAEFSVLSEKIEALLLRLKKDVQTAG